MPCLHPSGFHHERGAGHPGVSAPDHPRGACPQRGGHRGARGCAPASLPEGRHEIRDDAGNGAQAPPQGGGARGVPGRGSQPSAHQRHQNAGYVHWHHHQRRVLRICARCHAPCQHPQAGHGLSPAHEADPRIFPEGGPPDRGGGAGRTDRARGAGCGHPLRGQKPHRHSGRAECGEAAQRPFGCGNAQGRGRIHPGASAGAVPRLPASRRVLCAQ